MPIDPSIIMSVKPFDIKERDPITDITKVLTLKHLMQQNDLGGLQYETAKRGVADDEATRQAFIQSGGDNQRARALLSQSGQYKALQALDKTILEDQTKRATLRHTNAQTGQIDAGHIAGALAAIAKDGGSDSGLMNAENVLSQIVGPERAKASIDQIRAVPLQERVKFALTQASTNKVGQDALKILFPQAHMQNFGGTTAPVSTSTLPGSAPGGVIPGGVSTPNTATPDALMTDTRVKSEGVFNRANTRAIANSGQGVTMRGQDMTAGTAQAGQDAATDRANARLRFDALNANLGVGASDAITAPQVGVPPAVGAPGAQRAPVAIPGNNYGNIRPVGATQGFQQFATPEAGIAAIDQNLQAYGKRGINTLSSIISTWAPPNENPTAALIANASKRLGLDPNKAIDLNNPAVRHMVTAAIMQQEHGGNVFGGGGRDTPSQPMPRQDGAPPGTQGAYMPPDTSRFAGDPTAVAQPELVMRQQPSAGAMDNRTTMGGGAPAATPAPSAFAPATSPTAAPNADANMSARERAKGAKPLTEFQGKAQMFGTRAAEADKVMSALEDKISTTGLAIKRSIDDGVLGRSGLGAVANVALSDNQQKVEQAQRNFVNAVLRNESGAAIAPSEFQNAIKQYFPRPGDSKAVIEQKRQNRQSVIEGFKLESGSAGQRVENARGSPAQSAVRIRGDDGYNALAKGARYIGPDNIERVKN